jgi:predicted nucleic acid-binding protein
MNADSPLYLDTSCLLKLFFLEPESEAVVAALSGEHHVVVSELTRLEAETQLRARLVGGLLTRPRHRRITEELTRTLSREPFVVAAFPMDAFGGAREIAQSAKVHCRTLDLLHLAAMSASGLKRLFTNDRTQCKVARSLGLSVLVPGGSAEQASSSERTRFPAVRT